MNKIVQYNKIKTVIINGRNKCIYMKPRGILTYDIFSTNGIGAVKFYPSVRGGVI